MAEADLQEDGGTKKKGGMMPTILAFVVVTAIGGGGGALLGIMLGGKPAPSVPVAEPAAADEAEADHGTESGGETAKASGAHGEETIGELEAAKVPLKLLTLKPVLTNIYNPPNSWIRIEASLVIRDDPETNSELLAAEIEADTLAFARSLQLAQVEGTRGLLHLRDDLRERAKLRSPTVVDYLIQAMVVE